MNDVIFRQYDIRGKVGSELIIEEMYPLAQAILQYFKKNKPDIKTIAVGADGRIHSPIIKQRVCKAIQDAGFDVLFIGICPTPVMYFTLHNNMADAGLMITASHNGKEYNGIKICLGKESVWGNQIQEIKQLYKAKVGLSSDKIGSYSEQKIVDLYVAWLKNHFSHLIDYSIKAVVDCGNGAAGTVMPKLIQEMKWPNVALLYPEVDGNYPNHEADPIVEENMQDAKKLLLINKLDIAVGLDGDCDRMACLTKKGKLVQGDQLLAIFSQELLKDRPGSAVVFDIKCSSGLHELLERWGGKPCISPSGHSIIKEHMKKNKAVLAGELSCHFNFADRYFGFDDGIYALLRLFEILMTSGKTIDELLSVFPERSATPEIRMECTEENKWEIVTHVTNHYKKRTDVQLLTIDGIRVTYPYGWAMVRASNTQPVVCLRFEADSSNNLQRIKEDFMIPLRIFFSDAILIKYFNG